MSDPWVLKVQQWVNSTYGGRPGFVPAPTNGQTGWPTMAALTMALQAELGITTLSDSFGPTTAQKVADLGSTTSSWPVGVRKVLQAACYCKGYDAGDSDIDGIWSKIAPAIVEMQQDISLSLQGGNVTPKLFKSILTMDAYVLVDGGSADVRAIQRSLNLRYATNRADFAIVPTDGIYSRNTQQGMMYALQYEIGMADGVANGNFGPGTKQGIRDYASVSQGSSDSAKYFVHLFQAALRFNGYSTAYSGNFTPDTASTTRQFQQFAALPVTGNGDFATWASLLVSTGDTDRPGKAADMATWINPARAAALVANGYHTVGRYLTNTPVPDPLDKCLRPGELQTIFDAGLKVFPIFQEGGFELSYFSYSKGVVAGQRAHDAAKGFGFLPGTVIYFAVDFDAMDEEISDYLIPHFRGIRDAFQARGSEYRVGVYGARNICSRISNQGLAVYSFVSGMSWGFSGNLGFPLPQNWAYDQILEYDIPVSDGSLLGIDKNIVSNRDPGQSTKQMGPTFPKVENDKAIDFIRTISNLSKQHNNGQYSHTLAIRQLRSYTSRYVSGTSGAGWWFLGGEVDSAFDAAVKAQIPDSALPLAFERDPADRTIVNGFDWPHVFATASGYNRHGLSVNSTHADFPDFAGWGGDLTSLICEYLKTDQSEDSYAFARERMTNTNENVESSFPWEDVRGDAFGWLIAKTASESPNTNLATLVENILENVITNQKNIELLFAQARWGTRSELESSAGEAVSLTVPNVLYESYRTALFHQEGVLDKATTSAFTDIQRAGFKRALVEAYWP